MGKKTNEMTKTSLESFLEEIGDLENKADESLSNYIDGILSNISFGLNECETPIEKIFFINFYREFSRSFLHNSNDIFEFNPQMNIPLKDKKYRVDFLIECADIKKGSGFKFVIECDGHEFHEKTKEQAERDKKRERDLLENGYIVIRFTGSEIYKEPNECARQAMQIIHKHVKENERRR